MLPKNVVPIYIVYIQFCRIPECQHKYTPCVEIHIWLLNVKKTILKLHQKMKVYFFLYK